MTNSEVVRWIEIWLDNAGERAYQPAFVSALAYSQYEVLHSTSHTSLELGKDVIARAPSGELIAFQLKGNPGSRLTMSQWHAIYDQIVQLVIAPLPSVLSGKHNVKHTPILVTNGEIDEDVQAAISYFNASFVVNYPTALPLKIWKRGDLIALFAKVAGSIWPTKLETQVNLLRCISKDYRDSIDPEDIQEISLESLDWRGKKPSVQRSLERISGLATILSILVSRHYDAGNYFEAIKAKTIATGIVAGYIAKHRLSTKKHTALFLLMRRELFSLVANFANRISTRFGKSPMVNEDIFKEFGIYAPRKMLVTAILAVHLLEAGEVASDAVRDFVLKRVDYPFLVSEALVPPFLAVFWAKQNFSGLMESDREAHSVLWALITKSLEGSLISSYYSLEEVLQHQYKAYLGRNWHEIDRDQRHLSSQFAFVLLCLLVRRNWKQTCKGCWPGITQIHRDQTTLLDKNEFAFCRSERATNETRVVKYPMRWPELINEVRQDFHPNVPESLVSDPVMCLLVTLFLPYRATEELLLWLDRKFCTTWY